LAGLALIGLGGCFLVGVLSLVTSMSPSVNAAAPAIPSPSHYVLMAVLYALAFACFAAAAFLLVLGVRWLYRIMHA
jgi:hypothetical protein